MAGALVYAELADRRPDVGGQYAYLRDAYGPTPAFLYGWSLLLVIQSGGMAAVAITFARYFLDLAPLPISEGAIASAVLLLLVGINCLGVRAGGTVQSGLMVLKILAIALLVIAGWCPPPPTRERDLAGEPAYPLRRDAVRHRRSHDPGHVRLWRLADGKLRGGGDARSAPRPGAGVAVGVAGVVILYTSVAFVCLYALGPTGLAQSTTPAADSMRMALGERERR